MISRLPAYWTVPVLMPPYAGGFAFSWAVFISVIVALVLFRCTLPRELCNRRSLHQSGQLEVGFSASQGLKHTWCNR